MSSTPSTGTGPQPVGLAEGAIKTVAGTGAYGYVSASDNGPGGQAQINYPRGVAMDKNGNLYIADTNNNRVRKVTPDGIITTFAGNGTTESTKDNVPATSTSLNRPWGVAADDAGNLYIADSRNQRVRKVAPDGIITTFAGNGTAGQATDNVPATSTSLDS
ncbi:Teneurin-2, partial [Streptomyces syringium]|uniref:NHL domain-containing protein n=1 Tax=Streptomyces syringium TaxID=76729 RepID=UPI0033C737C5